MLIPEEIRKCVFFLAYDGPGGALRPRATGFFVAIANENNTLHWVYAVTAAHCIKRAGSDIFIKVNSKEGSARTIKTNQDQWRIHETADVALIGFDAEPWMDFKCLKQELFASRSDVGIGDDIFIVGLFSKHAGSTKNIPIARVGNIAALPEEPMKTSDQGNIDAYLIECRSIGGLSGSPVLVVTGPAYRVGESELAWNFSEIKIRLLGLIHGHWDTAASNIDVADDASDTLERINTGIAVVSPATAILDILNSKDFVLSRELDERKFETENVPPNN